MVLIQLEIPIDTAVAAARVGRDAGAVVIVNASPAVHSDGAAVLAEIADVVVVNESEASDWLIEGRQDSHAAS